MRGIVRSTALAALFAVLALFAGCGDADVSTATPAVSENSPTLSTEPAPPESAAPESAAPTETMELIPLTESPAMFIMPMPEAAGVDVLGNEKAEIDVSNKKDGYIMVKFLEQTDKQLVIQIKGPSGTVYQYILNNKGDYDVFPLSDGNGSYQIGVFQNVSGQQFSTAFTASLTVELADEFAPFIRPNRYVNYTEDSLAVKKSAELTQNTGALLEKVSAVYGFIINNISYDKELAQQITAKTVKNYVPDIDAVLESGKGICFDYASLMTAMLRCQGIPTKLVSGYAGSVPHAWINVYSDETGWIDGVIYFDGVGWKLMDPTFAATGGQSDDVLQYIGDGSNYTDMFFY